MRIGRTILTLVVLIGTSGPALAQRGYAAQIDAAKQAMLADPSAALRHARAARAKAANITTNDATARWLEGEALTRLGRPREALATLAAGIAEVERTSAGGKLHGDLLRARGNAHGVGGEAQAALSDFQRAHDIYRKAGERRGQAMALQNIGAIYTDAGDYPRVLRYYQQSAEVFDGDPALLLAAHNNLGRALRDLGRLAEAEVQFGKALRIARKLNSPMLEESILENLAAAQVDAGHINAAEASLARARQIVGDDPDASRFIWGIAAQIASRRGDMAGSAAFLERTFAGNAVDGEPAFREFHRTAYGVYKALGRDGLALAHLESFKQLDDRARTLAASTNAALMAARFDFQNQDLKISSLKAGQAQKDAELAASRARFESTLFGGALAVAATILALVLIALFHIRRSRNETRLANAGLSTANAALEKALRAKTEFLATTSHEIRTPLNGILGMTQVLLADRKVEPGMRDKIRLVHGAGETMRALVDDILDIAKMETGNLVLEPAPMRLHMMLTQTADLWRAQAEMKGLTLTLDLGDAPDRILADETRLRQVVFNLMSNAVKFTEAGGVTLVAGVVGGRLSLTVTDTGIGIPPEALAVIFESFRQVDGGTTRKFGGTGLGLAICRNIAVAMDGEVLVDSDVGRGSRFTLLVPLSVDESAQADGCEAEATDRVLLVEANPLTRSVLFTILGKQFAGVDAAGDLTEAADALSTRRYRVLLVDRVTLGGAEDAPAAVRQLADRARGTPMVVLCPPGGQDEQGALVRSGAAEVLVKPLPAPAIVAALTALSTATADRAVAA